MQINYASGCLWMCLATLTVSLSHSEPNEAVPVRTFEDFSGNPLARGWQVTGETNLFTWDSGAQNLQITWDSSNSNSYFRLPLGTIATAADDFSVTLDLLLHDIAAGVRPEFPGAMQIAFGFQNRADADKPEFIRGTATTPNLVEFNYFPDTGFGATVWPVMVLSSGIVNYHGNGDFSIFELPTGVLMNITLEFTASNRRVSLAVRTNGTLVGPITGAPIAAPGEGFFVDAFAIASYSEAGQDPNFPGSILAHGTIDSIEIVAPPPPIREMRGGRTDGNWEQRLLSARGWSYVLEASDDLLTWIEVSPPVTGSGDWISLRAPDDPPRAFRFFRVKAVRL